MYKILIYILKIIFINFVYKYLLSNQILLIIKQK